MATEAELARRRAGRLAARMQREGRSALPATITGNIRAAYARLTSGTPLLDARVGQTQVFHHQRQFGNVGAALRWGQNNLPASDSAYLMARGTLRESSGTRPAGQRAWVGLTEWTRARYLTRQIDEANDELQRLLTDYNRIVLRWRTR